jgi:hypothetical protein
MKKPKPYYIQRKDGRDLETVDEFNDRKACAVPGTLTL